MLSAAMAEALDYYDPNGLSATFYDLVAHYDPTLQGELDFYQQLIPEGTWLLELGCGTGRIGLPLAERNRAVVGLDLAPAMLARAEAKRARLAPEVVQRTGFVRGDMTGFSLDLQFDAVIAPFFGLSHLPRGPARRSTFETVARHLKPGGVAAIHTVLPSAVTSPGPVDPARPVLDVAFDAEGRRLQLYVSEQGFDAVEGRFEQRLDYVVIGPDGAEAQRSHERLTYHVSDLEADAHGSGLVLERKLSPFATLGEMWVFRRS